MNVTCSLKVRVYVWLGLRLLPIKWESYRRKIPWRTWLSSTYIAPGSCLKIILGGAGHCHTPPIHNCAQLADLTTFHSSPLHPSPGRALRCPQAAGLPFLFLELGSHNCSFCQWCPRSRFSRGKPGMAMKNPYQQSQAHFYAMEVSVSFTIHAEGSQGPRNAQDWYLHANWSTDVCCSVKSRGSDISFYMGQHEAGMIKLGLGLADLLPMKFFDQWLTSILWSTKKPIQQSWWWQLHGLCQTS